MCFFKKNSEVYRNAELSLFKKWQLISNHFTCNQIKKNLEFFFPTFKRILYTDDNKIHFLVAFFILHEVHLNGCILMLTGMLHTFGILSRVDKFSLICNDEGSWLLDNTYILMRKEIDMKQNNKEMVCEVSIGVCLMCL